MALPNPAPSKRSMPFVSIEGYGIVEKIGCGSYSTVYKGYKTAGQRDLVAIKCVEKNKLSPSGVENIITEIRMLKMLHHKNIVQMKEFQWDDRYIYIVMEYCDGGDLSRFIRKRHKLPESVCKKFMQQLAMALKFLRSHNICHLDLKPQNLLLVTGPQLTLKIGDFGFAQFLSNEAYQSSLRGSPLYMAPEMLVKRHYDAKVDLWSVGVIAYECLFGKAPYSSSSFKELQEKILSQVPIEIPENCGISHECRDLLTRLLKHDPAERTDYDTFFAHPFLDLEHLPSPESYKKAVQLVHKAVKCDADKEHKEAFNLYCEALRYLVPHVQAETDEEKKATLKAKVTEYTKRAEELKAVLFKPPEKTSVKTEAKKASVTSSEGNGSVDLRSLCLATPNMQDALEIGNSAQMYVSEGQYKLALEKFESCLGILVPLLATEPTGIRKDLLYKQVQDWLKQAENVKALISYVDMNQNISAHEAKGKKFKPSVKSKKLLKYLHETDL